MVGAVLCPALMQTWGRMRAICVPRAIFSVRTAPVSRAQWSFLSISQAPGGPAYAPLFLHLLVIVTLSIQLEWDLSLGGCKDSSAPSLSATAFPLLFMPASFVALSGRAK